VGYIRPDIIIIIIIIIIICIGRDSSVGIATRYGLEGPGVDFTSPPDRPEAHPAAYTMGTGSFPGVKLPGSWR